MADMWSCFQTRTGLLPCLYNTNYEIESSTLAGLSKLMGHKAVTVCMVVTNRFVKEAGTTYRKTMDTCIQTTLDRI
jgi:uridine phosphorylase